MALRLRELLDVAPARDYDPENEDQGVDSDDEGTDKQSTVRDSYAPVSESKLRKRQPLAIAGTKYAGRRVSRKDLDDEDEQDDNEEEENEDDEDDEDEDEEDEDEEDDDEEDDDEEDDHDEEDDEDDEDDGAFSSKKLAVPVEASDELLMDLKNVGSQSGAPLAVIVNPLEEAEKGRHVKQQLMLWDKTMDARIRSQRAMLLVNRFPSPKVLKAMAKADSNLAVPLNAAKHSILRLMDDLVEMQQTLQEQQEYADQDRPAKRIKLSGGDGAVVAFPAAERVWEVVSAPYNAFAVKRNELIDKWSGRSVSSFGSNKKTLKALNQSIEAQLQQVMTDKDRLLKRIHSNRATTRILGTKRSAVIAAVNEEIIDDSDFYQQQLRDVIESKASGNADGADDDDPAVLARQWLATQQYKQKVKNRVDTRASKGRKIRYDSHAKLVNFMVPVPTDHNWHDGMRDVLFSSLLGKHAASLPASAADEDDE